MPVASHRLVVWTCEGNEKVFGEYTGSLFACLKEFTRISNRNPWRVRLFRYDGSTFDMKSNYVMVMEYNRFGVVKEPLPFPE